MCVLTVPQAHDAGINMLIIFYTESSVFYAFMCSLHKVREANFWTGNV
jgi:hypothetical protein